MILLAVATLTQLWFWGVRFARLARYRLPNLAAEPDTDLPPVSVIICARNEAENLRRNLPFFLEQDYPEFEILVVDDNSSDNSRAIVLEFQKKYRTLRLLSMQRETPPGKKAALSYGIQHSSFELLFLSDADCRPLSRNWLKTMQRSLRGEKKIVLGYGPYQYRSGWLNRFIRFEAFYTTIQYFSFALAGRPYMGVGRNLAYHRSVYRQANGFASHAHLASGDDDLFVNQTATAKNTTINLFPDAFVSSRPHTSWRGYYYQKRRHLSVSSHYRRQDRIALGALAFSHFTFYATLFLLAVLLPEAWHYLTLIYLVRIGVVLLVFQGAGKHLGERDLLPFLPLLDLLYLLFYFVFAPSLLIGSRIQQWK